MMTLFYVEEKQKDITEVVLLSSREVKREKGKNVQDLLILRRSANKEEGRILQAQSPTASAGDHWRKASSQP